MTETSLASPPKQVPAHSAPAHPADVLLHLIVTLLARMFLPAADGDIAFARMAAFETINQYSPRNHIDLIAIAQIIAGSLTALSSASLALTGNLPLGMVLRFRANAVAFNRVVEQARRALSQSQLNDRGPEKAFVPNPNQAQYEETVLAELAAVQLRTAEALARYDFPDPVATPAPAKAPNASPPVSAPAPSMKPIAPAATAPAPAAAPIPAPTTPAAIARAASTPTQTGPAPTATAREISEREWQARWASAMTDVAQEFTADLQNLPPAERALASRRAEILAGTARQLLSGDVPPRPRPGDLDGHRKT